MTNPDQLTLSISRLVEDLASRVRLYDVSVAGIEVTQSIQYYDAEGHLTDPADRGADNSVTLAAYKAAYVRVYLRSGLLAASIPNLTGSLVVERRRSNGLSFVFQPVATYSPIAPGTVTAEQDPAYTTERGALGSSLNFIIPASECYGSLRLTAHIQGHPNATKTIVVAARLVQTLRVRAILVHYNGPSTANPAPGTAAPTIDLPEPTLAELQTTASTALAMMPVQATGSFAVSGHMNWFEPLDDARSGAGACSINWNSFLVWLGLMRDADGNRGDVVYFGLLPTGMPLNVPGCGQSGIGAGAVGDGATMVHEMGHGYGFAHTPAVRPAPPTPTTRPTSRTRRPPSASSGWTSARGPCSTRRPLGTTCRTASRSGCRCTSTTA
ncbi:hypothetical protein [Leifsonia xyli]|uniref:hypothetical protein n=1 Tax=Leifsonia xyli TaxID=1575 RepID=UPI003D67B376